jgi:FemAB-related protein (PEP-CTERM system-associated)
MKLLLCENSNEAQRWDNYVNSHPSATYCHLWGWKQVIENSFRWQTYYLAAEENDQFHGVLPLVVQKSWLFGRFVSSMPFLNSGGILAESREAELLLLEEAVRITREVRAKHLELRHQTDHKLDLPTRTNKVTVVLRLDPDHDKMWKALNTKIRTKVRKSMSFGMTSDFGGENYLPEFYSVWSENMRDLGTPAYSAQFFGEIVRVFSRNTHLCVVRHRGRAVAVSFLIGFRDRVEAVWSSSVRDSLNLKPNMLLYWNLFCFAAQQRYKVFDFGRSTVDSGTHAFKLQWGAETVPLHWNYWLAAGDKLPEINPSNRKYELAIRMWQKMPLSFTRLLGPHIARCLP